MFLHPTRLRQILTVSTALSFAFAAMPALAQDDTAAPDSTSSAAPPTRVGEISNLTGSVSFNGAGSSGQWIGATLNYPVATSDSLYTQAGAQATVAVESSRLTLAENTELQVTSLNDNSLAATESQGEMFLAVSYIQPGETFVITTPRGTVTIGQNGNYDIAVGDQTTPTVVTVLDGAATVADPGATLQVAAGQSAVLSGTDQTVAQLGTAQQDAFITSMLAANSTATAAAPPAYAPPVVQQMTGVTALASYGSWSQNSSYGAVWYPSVGADWAPYREGHWAYVQPWGYTWVDNEPWGFAPFHYGRWIDDGDRWGWVPAPAYADYGGGGYSPEYRPVYAPAVVSFFGGVGVGVGIGLTIGALSSGSIGWVPLGPNEVFHPYYGYGGSPTYINRINYVNVRRTDITNINNSVHNTTIINNYNNYTNRRGATYIDAAAMSRGEPVGRYGKPVPQDLLAKAQPIAFRPGAGAPNGGYAAPGLPPPAFQHRAAPAPHLSAFGERRQLPPAIISHEPAPNLRPGQPYAGPGQRPGLPAAGPGQRPGQPAAEAIRPGQPPQNFGGNPGFHPPPPPPGGGQHPGLLGAQHPGLPGAARPGLPGAEHPGLPGAEHPGLPGPAAAHPGFGAEPGFHPPPAPPGGNAPHPMGEPAHPNLPNVVHPGEPVHPAGPNQFHPLPNVYNGGANHPQGQPAYHPQPTPPAYHPQPTPPAYHPQPEQPAYHPQPAPPAYHPQPPPAYHPQPAPPAYQPQETHVNMPPPPRPEVQAPPAAPQHEDQRPDQRPDKKNQ